MRGIEGDWNVSRTEFSRQDCWLRERPERPIKLHLKWYTRRSDFMIYTRKVNQYVF